MLVHTTIEDCVSLFQTGAALAQINPSALLFSPAKMLMFTGWFYLCFYCAQKLQYSTLVSSKFRSLATFVALFLGPICILAMMILVPLKQSLVSGARFSDTLRDYLEDLVAGARRLGAASEEEEPALVLLDSSGRSMDEIYGHNDKRRVDSRALTLTETIIAEALDQRASDILIDPRSEQKYAIRFRVDGLLRTFKEVDSEISRAVVNSIKAVSSMDISEKRRPQDGAFVAKKGGATSSFRVASAGVLNGEKLSIRVLNHHASTHSLDDIGWTKKQLTLVREMVAKPSGMILICGPTGSGKTSTMYAMLNEMDRFTRNVITVEDPIEAILPEASQIEINVKADITFAKALRSILRQDPDVICVGEIRDEETAEIALRAAQTGHLVLATLHCDSNAAAIIRLLDLGVSPALIASGLHLVISQRLLRCLCEACKGPAEFTPSQIREFKRTQVAYQEILAPVGCRRCNDTGYYGRTAVGDLTVVTAQLKTSIAQNKGLADQLRDSGAKKGSSNLNKQALRKVVSGLTTLEEITRVIG